MSLIKYLIILFALFFFIQGMAQNEGPSGLKKKYPIRQLTIEPGIGIHSNPGSDILLTNLMSWNPGHHLSFAAHTSFNFNNITQRNFNGIQTDYNYSINQKFGIGTTFYAKRSSNTFLLMAGAKYTTFRESIIEPEQNPVSAAISSLSPDYGLLYNLKKGIKRYYFSFRAYVPLYPWPVKDISIWAVDGNMNNIALEFGLGIKIK